MRANIACIVHADPIHGGGFAELSWILAAIWFQNWPIMPTNSIYRSRRSNPWLGDGLVLAAASFQIITFTLHRFVMMVMENLEGGNAQGKDICI